MKYLITCILALMMLTLNDITVSAQSFYVHTAEKPPQDNSFYILNVQNATTTKMPDCRPTASTQVNGQTFTDMAADKEGNLWYVTNYGDLYRRNKKPHDTSCTFIGKFPVVFPNSLVASEGGVLYASGIDIENDYRIASYDITGFKLLGKLPRGMGSSGDLFFYKNRLFLACYGMIAEITLPDPSKSCRFMDLPFMTVWGAFTTGGDGNAEVYLTNIYTPPGLPQRTQLVRVDMAKRKIADTIRTYPFVVNGAATYYSATGVAATCTPLSVTATADPADHFFQVLNPSRDAIRVHTNIPAAAIADISLFDASGKCVQHYEAQAITTGMDASWLAGGLYILRLTTATGTVYVQKMVKE